MDPLGSLQRSLCPLAGVKGKVREKGKEGNERRRKRREEEGKGGANHPTYKILDCGFAVSCTVLETYSVEYYIGVTLKSGLGVVQGH